jgi:gamma-glutamylcyclotransferase (GGCT)/AIG2-like uncharacterized protein YtfP
MLYFSYGMNTNRSGMSQRCPQAQSLGAANLPGWRFRFAGPADIQRDRRSNVHGVLWDITARCLDNLDVLEGYPFFYNRRWVDVEFKNNVMPALVYYMQPGHRNEEPTQWYFETLLEGYREHGVLTDQLWANFPRYRYEMLQKNNTWSRLTEIDSDRIMIKL